MKGGVHVVIGSCMIFLSSILFPAICILYWTHEVKVLCNEACLSVTPWLENCSKDFIKFLHNNSEQYYKKTDQARFSKKDLNQEI